MSSKKSTLKLFKEKIKPKVSKDLLKMTREQALMRSKITKALASGPKTIPEIAKEIGVDIYIVTWYILTFNRYKLLESIEKTDEGYWKYKAVS